MSSKQTAFDVVSDIDLTGKVFLITGAYSGLGAATTKALLKAGVKVIITGRNEKSQATFAKELLADKKLKATEAQIDASHTLDLGNLESVRDFADYVDKNYEQIDCLINNAGVMNTPPGKTKDGFEIQMGVNVIGHFLLSKKLAEKTKRQVWLSSSAHNLIGTPPGDVNDNIKAPRINIEAIENIDESNYDGWHRYQQSKLGDILLAKQFPLEYKHLKTCAVHPGVVRTNLARHISILTKLKYLFRGLIGKGQPLYTPDRGASTQTWCAIMPAKELVNGAYYANCARKEEAQSAKNMEDAKKLYDFCDKVTKAFQ